MSELIAHTTSSGFRMEQSLLYEIIKKLIIPNDYNRFSYYGDIVGDSVCIMVRLTSIDFVVSRITVALSDPQLIQKLQEFLDDRANRSITKNSRKPENT